MPEKPPKKIYQKHPKDAIPSRFVNAGPTPRQREEERKVKEIEQMILYVKQCELADEYGRNLKRFLKAAWPVLSPGTPLAPSWHIEAIAEHTQAVFEGQIKRLIISISPRSLKSKIISVAAPAWWWINHPEEQFLCASYSRTLAMDFSRQTRNLIQSNWYQARWKEKFKLSYDQNEKFKFENDKGGSRVGYSVEGGIVGVGGSISIYDDPNDLNEMSSPAYRQAVKDWYSGSASSRFINPQTDRRMCVQQRASYGDDLTSFLLELGGWEHLVIPMEFDGNRRISSIGWSDPRTHIGELMHPARFGVIEIDQLKKEQRENFSGQFNQKPVGSVGDTLKSSWFRFFNPAGVDRRDEKGDIIPVVISTADGESVRITPIQLPAAFEQVVTSVDCLDSETEILTRDGWRGRGAVGVDDFVYSLNKETQGLELVPVEAYVERPMDAGERFVRIFSSRIDIRVTERHNMYVSFPYGNKKINKWSTVTAADLVSRNNKYRIPLSGEYSFHGVYLSDDELRFIAWFITDGGFQLQYIKISQAKEYKHEIRDLIKRLGLDFIEKTSESKSGFPNGKPLTSFLIPKGMSGGKANRSGWNHLTPWLDKSISPYLMMMDARQFQIFWKELLKGDGCRDRLCCGKDKNLADRIQHMAATRGYASYVSSRPSAYGTQIWYVSCRKATMINANPKVKRMAKLFFEDPSIGEVVWCVKNCNSTLITRRHGRTVILGNCAFKNAEHNDYVAAHAWGRLGANTFLIGREHGHMSFTETKAMMRRFAGLYPCPEKLVEDAANGPAILDELKNELPGLIGVPAYGSKWSRVAAIAGYVEAGNVHLPNPDLFPWVWDLLREFSDGRSSKHDDDTDAMSQALKRLYDGMAHSGLPEFRVQPRLGIGEPESACHVSGETVPMQWRRYIAIIPGLSAVWIAETPTGSLRVLRELSLDKLDAAKAGIEIARLSLGDCLARASQIRNIKQAYELFFPKEAFAVLETGSYAELLETGLLSFEPEDPDFDARIRAREVLRAARFRSDMIEEEPAAIDRLRGLLAFQPPDFHPVPYDRKKAHTLADQDIQQYADYMASVDNVVRGEWPKLKIHPSCKELISQLGSFRRDKPNEVPTFVQALLLGVCAPRQHKPAEVIDRPWPVGGQRGMRNSRLMARKFAMR